MGKEKMSLIIDQRLESLEKQHQLEFNGPKNKPSAEVLNKRPIFGFRPGEPLNLRLDDGRLAARYNIIGYTQERGDQGRVEMLMHLTDHLGVRHKVPIEGLMGNNRTIIAHLNEE